jgi:dUTP pyrophosphatase
MFNFSENDYKGKILLIAVSCGDRIAQLVVEKIDTPNVVEVEVECALMQDLDDTTRGSGGYGSTGL